MGNALCKRGNLTLSAGHRAVKHACPAARRDGGKSGASPPKGGPYTEPNGNPLRLTAKKALDSCKDNPSESKSAPQWKPAPPQETGMAQAACAGNVCRQRVRAAKQSTRGHRSMVPPEAQHLRLLHAGRCVMSPEPLPTLPACCKTFLLHAGQVGTSAGKLPTCPAWSTARLLQTRKVGKQKLADAPAPQQSPAA